MKDAKYLVNCSTGPGADSGVKYTVTSDMTTNLRGGKANEVRGRVRKLVDEEGDWRCWPTWRLVSPTRASDGVAAHMSAVMMRLQSIWAERELKMDESTRTSETQAISLLCERPSVRGVEGRKGLATAECTPMAMPNAAFIAWRRP